MNKTVKTIAWICLVLGLLGVAVDIGVYVHGRTIAAQMAEWIETGEMPGIGRRFDGADSDEIITPEKSKRWDIRPFGGTFPGGMRGSVKLPRQVPGSYGFSRFGFVGAPMVLLAAGPILAVIGAVTLIVNREPLESDIKKKKVKKQKE